MFNSPPPLGLYIHLPWCEKKCPYCDFTSHETGTVPEQAYVEALLQDLEQDLPLIWGRRVESIFIGGGTPSLFSGAAIEQLFSGLRARLNLSPAIEVTLESNPGSADANHYRAYFQSGINRLSIGVQSFDNRQLKNLGRIHDRAQALRAVQQARDAGFENINLDLMYGLPGQTVDDAIADLQQAIDLQPQHLSHYQLTIEPNTLFHHRPPAQMPDDELSWQQQVECQSLLDRNGYQQYEISAYRRGQKHSRHNLNYWQFGDYIGIGAGAHGKLTLVGEDRVIRRVRVRQPKDYLARTGADRIQKETELGFEDLVFEFMLNSLRLIDGFDSSLFQSNTGLALHQIQSTLNAAIKKELLTQNGNKIAPTALGLRYLNDLQAMFLTLPERKNKPFFESNSGIMHN